MNGKSKIVDINIDNLSKDMYTYVCEQILIMLTI